MNLQSAFEAFKWFLGAVRIQSPAKREVLIVEDSTNDAELLRAVVEKLGYIAHVRATLNSALVALKDRAWHRVFLDMNLGSPVLKNGMTIMEGTIFTEEALNANPNVKIVYVTGHAASLEGNVNTAQFPCIVKGIDNRKFNNAISAVLTNGDQAQDVRLWRLFLFWFVCCVACLLIGCLMERFQVTKWFGL